MHNYKNEMKDWDPFLREAFFHMEFVRIHPFDDGNGRTSRLIMAYNLCRQNIPPAIITRSDKEEYNQYIRDYDYYGLADFIRELSFNEGRVMDEVLNPHKSVLVCNLEERAR